MLWDTVMICFWGNKCSCLAKSDSLQKAISMMFVRNYLKQMYLLKYFYYMNNNELLKPNLMQNHGKCREVDNFAPDLYYFIIIINEVLKHLNNHHSSSCTPKINN